MGFLLFAFAAAIARLIYLKKGLGVGALTRHFGGRHRKGTRTEKFRRSSSGVIRHILQQLEESGTIVKWYVRGAVSHEGCGGCGVATPRCESQHGALC